MAQNINLVMIDNYDSFTYNLVQYFQTLGTHVKVIRNDGASVDDLVSNPKTDLFVISPGPSTPDQAGVSLELIRACQVHKKPLLGVCLGHQAIGQAFGAKIIRAPLPVHGKVAQIYHHQGGGKGVFKGLPSPLKATRYHSLVIDHETLPDCLEITAATSPESGGIIMGVRHREAPIEGVQFHPESILTEHGLTMLQNFVNQI